MHFSYLLLQLLFEIQVAWHSNDNILRRWLHQLYYLKMTSFELLVCLHFPEQNLIRSYYYRGRIGKSIDFYAMLIITCNLQYSIIIFVVRRFLFKSLILEGKYVFCIGLFSELMDFGVDLWNGESRHKLVLGFFFVEILCNIWVCNSSLLFQLLNFSLNRSLIHKYLLK